MILHCNNENVFIFLFFILVSSPCCHINMKPVSQSVVSGEVDNVATKAAIN